MGSGQKYFADQAEEEYSAKQKERFKSVLENLKKKGAADYFENMDRLEKLFRTLRDIPMPAGQHECCKNALTIISELKEPLKDG